MEQDIPVFGERSETLPQKTRACAYAVVVNSQGLVAAARESGRLFLPGGGIEFPETPAEAVHREVREELGCRIQLAERLGQALKYFQSDGACQALYATFYAAEFGEAASETHESELEWVHSDELFHEHHAWAARLHMQRLAARARADIA